MFRDSPVEEWYEKNKVIWENQLWHSAEKVRPEQHC